MPSIIPENLAESGTHVLVIGVSQYRHLADGPEPTPAGVDSELSQLSSAAGSAAAIADWLRTRLYLAPLPPLASLRVLLSPSAGEPIPPALAALLPANHAANSVNVIQALKEFRAACESRRDNHAVVYVAGHGVQLSKSGALLLLEDYAGPDQLNELQAALDLTSIHRAFNHAMAARHQFWFADVCRQVPHVERRFERLIGGIQLDERHGAVESSPLLLAAITGTAAYGMPGGHSLFCQALLWSVAQAGAATGADGSVDRWHVPLTRLTHVLPSRVYELANERGVEQFVEVSGMPNPAIFHVYPDVPNSRLEIDLQPTEARPLSHLTLRDETLNPVCEKRADWPVVADVRAGLYLMDIGTEAPFRELHRLVQVAPPSDRYEARVS